jgi:hypothetical protein
MMEDSPGKMALMEVTVDTMAFMRRVDLYMYIAMRGTVVHVTNDSGEEVFRLLPADIKVLEVNDGDA